MTLNRLFCLTLFIVFLLFTSPLSYGQTISPTNNTNEKDRIESLIYTNYIGKYEKLVYFTSSSYWSRSKANFFAYAFNNGRWEKLIIKFKLRKNDTWSKPDLKTLKCDSVPVKKLLAYFDEKGFWKLDRDSLDHQFQRQPDGRIRRYSITDATDYEFGSMNQGGYLKISAYEPDYFLEKMPEIKQREVFIKCREEFLKIWKGK